MPHRYCSFDYLHAFDTVVLQLLVQLKYVDFRGRKYFLLVGTGAELGSVTCGLGCTAVDYKHILCNEYAFMH